jgi:glycosyltransferase 2 family protein
MTPTATSERVEPPAGRAERPSVIRTAIGVMISLISLAACVVWALGQETPEFPQGAGNWALLVVATGLTGVTALSRGWRWHAILRWTEIRHRAFDAYGLLAVGYMGNNLLPARGGELLRIFLMGERSSGRRRQILGSVLAERALDAGTLVALFAVLAALDVGGSPAGRAPAFIAAAVVAGLLVAMVVYLRLRISGRFERFAARVRIVARPLRILLSRTGLLLCAATLAVWGVEAVICWLVAASLDLGIGPADACLVVVLASFFALIPAAPGYVGTFDAAVLFSLHALDVPSGAALGFAIMYRLVIFVPITLAGLALMIGRYGGLRDALARERRAEEVLARSTQ